MNSAKGIHFGMDGIESPGTGGLPRVRLQEKDGGVKIGGWGRLRGRGN